MPKRHRIPFYHNPFFAIVVMILGVFLAGEMFFLSGGRDRTQEPLAPKEGLTAPWTTYTNKTEKYAFDYPIVINGPITIRDDLVEMYEEVEGLVLLIDRIAVPDSPSQWLATQTKDLYSQKPLACFLRQEVTDIPSIASPGATLIHFQNPVVFLDNITGAESQRGSCSGVPRVRVILIKRPDKLLKVSFTGTLLSERVLSTLRFVD